MTVTIGNVKIESKAVLAPLAGITNSVFRLLCKKMGASLVFSEMISSDGIVRENEKTLSLIDFEENEKPIGIQLFGDSPSIIARAVSRLNPYRPDLIDLNFGCPQKKIIKKGAGAAILKDLNKMKQIASAAVKETDIPVTAKIRSGWNSFTIIAKEAALTLQDAGVHAVTIHPRTQTMGFSGKSDWSIIKDIKQAVQIPVIGNGDIDTPEKAKQMLDETGCDLIMIGRGSFGNPWIFKQINFFLEKGYNLPDVSFAERIDFCIDHLKLSVRKKGDYYGVIKMRKHIGWYTKGIPYSTEIRREINQIQSPAKIIDKLQNLKEKIENVVVQ